MQKETIISIIRTRKRSTQNIYVPPIGIINSRIKNISRATQKYVQKKQSRRTNISKINIIKTYIPTPIR